MSEKFEGPHGHYLLKGGFHHVKLPKEDNVSRHWDKIFKRGQHLKDALG